MRKAVQLCSARHYGTLKIREPRTQFSFTSPLQIAGFSRTGHTRVRPQDFPRKLPRFSTFERGWVPIKICEYARHFYVSSQAICSRKRKLISWQIANAIPFARCHIFRRPEAERIRPPFLDKSNWLLSAVTLMGNSQAIFRKLVLAATPPPKKSGQL